MNAYVTVTCTVLSAGSVIAGYRVVLCMSPVARTLIMALCLQVHTKGGKVRYKYSSAGTAWSLLDHCADERCYVLYVCDTHEGVPDL